MLYNTTLQHNIWHSELFCSKTCIQQCTLHIMFTCTTLYTALPHHLFTTMYPVNCTLCRVELWESRPSRRKQLTAVTSLPHAKDFPPLSPLLSFYLPFHIFISLFIFFSALLSWIQISYNDHCLNIWSVNSLQGLIEPELCISGDPNRLLVQMADYLIRESLIFSSSYFNSEFHPYLITMSLQKDTPFKTQIGIKPWLYRRGKNQPSMPLFEVVMMHIWEVTCVYLWERGRLMGGELQGGASLTWSLL